jgi:hypothetical protein
VQEIYLKRKRKIGLKRPKRRRNNLKMMKIKWMRKR